MSKRLIRIGAVDVPARLNELSGQDLHVVLRSGHTHLGQLLTYSPYTLTIRDSRGHRHVIPVAEMEEVIYDKKSSY
ncbi:hypothetical protein [Telluribacter sp. SYSU D00476]|uniref:hypothetical protein n=1 Tax=Telluribacter sp. SYSU D00476 TaxID=2811430 RepID=UPI001FF35A25|nr:hypothetical protein [Telluribacter sp. SYSU D00476]